MTTDTKRLSLKQEKFVDEYISNGGNATQAALTAYDVACKQDAGNIGRANLDKSYIQDAINAKLREYKDQVLDKVNKLGSMTLAIESAHDDLTSSDPKVRNEARKFILEVSKFLTDSMSKTAESKHIHFNMPKFKG